MEISTAALVLPWSLGIWEGEPGSTGAGQRTGFTATEGPPVTDNRNLLQTTLKKNFGENSGMAPRIEDRAQYQVFEESKQPRQLLVFLKFLWNFSTGP